MNNEQREQQMMANAEAYAESVGYKDEHDLCATLNVFCAGWRAVCEAGKMQSGPCVRVWNDKF